MSVDGVLLSDVRRLCNEGRGAHLFVVTGNRGAGKSATLCAVLNGMRNRSPHFLLDAVLLDEAAVASGGTAEFSVYQIYYQHVGTEMEKLTAAHPCDFIFASGTVFVVDDLPALWELCETNMRAHLLRRTLCSLLRSPGCALVASAASVQSVPGCLTALAPLLQYALPAALSSAAVRRTVRQLSTAANDLAAYEQVAAACVQPTSTKLSLTLALCMARQADEEAVEEATGSVQQQQQLMCSSLRWLSGSDRDGAPVAAPQQRLYGLEEVMHRVSLIVSVFAAAGGASGGRLIARLPSSTGVLLHGPSGCGKSVIARQLASAFPALPFFFVSCTTLFSKYLGESEERLRAVYRNARAQAPAVVVLDDVDVVSQSRGAMQADGGGKSGGGLDVNRRMLAGLLCELDGVTDNSGVLTIATTNAPHVIDAALLRQGRLETLIMVPALSEAGARAMCNQFFSSFEGESEQKETLASVVAHRAKGCTAAAVQFALRKIFEQVLHDALATTSPDSEKVAQLSLPSVECVHGVLFACNSMMPPVQYTHSVS